MSVSVESDERSCHPARQREALLLAHLPQVDRIAASVARRLRAAEREDFVAHVRLKLVENDYAVLGRFAGRSRLTTYLTPVVRRLFIDEHVRRQGRFRPSAAARRLGRLAVRAEALLARDGLTRDEAVAVLRADPQAPRSGAALEALVHALPARAQRPREQPADVAEPAGDGAVDHLVRRAELEACAMRAGRLLRAALNQLTAAERDALRLRFGEGRDVADVARALGQAPRDYYRRFARLLRRLRQALEARGLTREDVRTLLSGAPLFVPTWSGAGSTPASCEDSRGLTDALVARGEGLRPPRAWAARARVRAAGRARGRGLSAGGASSNPLDPRDCRAA